MPGHRFRTAPRPNPRVNGQPRRSQHRDKQLRLDAAIRYGWICQRCLERIDPWRKYPDPMSLSLGHIIDCADGGQATLANTQPEHLSCNRRAGASRGGRTTNAYRTPRSL